MNLKPIIQKEFRQILRDRTSLAILLFIPVFLLIMFGYALNFDVKHIHLAVYDPDNSLESRKFIRHFLNSEYFDLIGYVSHPHQLDRLLETEQIRLAIVLPPDFSRSLMRSDTVKVQFLIDGANATAASTTIGYINMAIFDFNRRILPEITGQTEFPANISLADLRPRLWYNPELKSAKFLIPGMMGFILMMMSVVSTALSIVREKEKGTIEQILVSPIKPLELVLGKTIPYLFLALITGILILIAGYIFFQVKVAGSLLLLLLVTAIFLTCTLGMGLFISTIADTQQVAFMISIITTMLPAFILSGFVFPIRNMPFIIQLITHLFPIRFYLSAIRAIILKGVGISVIAGQIAILVIFCTVFIALSSVRLKKEFA